MENENVCWIREGCHRQYVLATCLITCWLLRLISCSQLNYLTNDDFLAAVVVLCNGWILMALASTVSYSEIKSTVHQRSKSMVTVFAIFALHFSFFTAVICLGTFKMFLDLFACERLAFEKLHWSSELGLIGEMQTCPWGVVERSESCFTHSCSLDIRSIVTNHPKRSIGLLASELLLFILPILICVIGDTFLATIKICFNSCCKSKESEEDQPQIISKKVVADGELQLSSVKYLVPQGTRVQSAVDSVSPPPYEV